MELCLFPAKLEATQSHGEAVVGTQGHPQPGGGNAGDAWEPQAPGESRRGKGDSDKAGPS